MSAAYDQARCQASILAEMHGVVMAVGYEQDDQGRMVPGYCPLAAVGPAFVIDVREVAEPSFLQRPGCVVVARPATPAEALLPGPVAAHLALEGWKRARSLSRSPGVNPCDT